MVLFVWQKQDHMTGDHRPNAAVSAMRDSARRRGGPARFRRAGLDRPLRDEPEVLREAPTGDLAGLGWTQAAGDALLGLTLARRAVLADAEDRGALQGARRPRS
jgi:hypothetical protein